MEKRNKRRQRCFTALTVLLVLFIWGHSCIPRSSSAAESGAVLTWLTPFFSHFLPPELITDHLVRKLAHFSEYGALGACMLHCAYFGTAVPQQLCDYRTVFLMGAGIAFLDESIQILSKRGAQIQDVWLDASGVAAGMVLVAAGHYLRNKVRKE